MRLNAHSRSWDMYVFKKKRLQLRTLRTQHQGSNPWILTSSLGVLMSRQISESIPKAAHLSGAMSRGKLGSKTFDLWQKMMVIECQKQGATATHQQTNQNSQKAFYVSPTQLVFGRCWEPLCNSEPLTTFISPRTVHGKPATWSKSEKSSAPRKVTNKQKHKNTNKHQTNTKLWHRISFACQRKTPGAGLPPTVQPLQHQGHKRQTSCRDQKLIDVVASWAGATLVCTQITMWGGVPATYHVRAEQKLRTPHPTGRLIRGVSGSNAEFARGFGLRNDGQEYRNISSIKTGPIVGRDPLEATSERIVAWASCAYFLCLTCWFVSSTLGWEHTCLNQTVKITGTTGVVPKAVELVVAWFHLTWTEFGPGGLEWHELWQVFSSQRPPTILKNHLCSKSLRTCCFDPPPNRWRWLFALKAWPLDFSKCAKSEKRAKCFTDGLAELPLKPNFAQAPQLPFPTQIFPQKGWRGRTKTTH